MAMKAMNLGRYVPGTVGNRLTHEERYAVFSCGGMCLRIGKHLHATQLLASCIEGPLTRKNTQRVVFGGRETEVASVCVTLHVR